MLAGGELYQWCGFGGGWGAVLFLGKADFLRGVTWMWNDVYDGREANNERPPYQYIGRYKDWKKPYVRSTPFLLETHEIRRSYHIPLTIHHPDAAPLHRVLLPIRLFITRLPIPLLLLVLRSSRSETRRPADKVIARIAIRL